MSSSCYPKEGKFVIKLTTEMLQVGLLSRVNVENHPNLVLLRRSNENWPRFVKVCISILLVFIVIFHYENETLSNENYLPMFWIIDCISLHWTFRTQTHRWQLTCVQLFSFLQKSYWSDGSIINWDTHFTGVQRWQTSTTV